MEEVNTQKLCNFKLGTQEGIELPIWIFVSFQQIDRQDSQNLHNNSPHKPTVSSAHVVIGTERYLDNSLLLNYDDDGYSQGYRQIKEAFKALTKNDILQQYISEHNFGSSNDG